MNILIKTLILISLSLIISAHLLAADLQKGIEAVDAGDYTTALKEFEPLAKQGDVDAQVNLGFLYYLGNGVEKNDKEAIKWFTLAAKQEDAIAQAMLGSIYANEKNYEEAIKWYILAAKQGSVVAQSFLGNMYAKGVGVPKDYILAYAWWNIAAANSDKVSFKDAAADAVNNRDKLEQYMTPSQIQQAQAKTKELMKMIKKK